MTARLCLKPPQAVDSDALFAFLGDPDAMRFTMKLADVEACRRHLTAHACQAKAVGFGPWIVMEKVSGTVIGFGGLYEDPFEPGWGPEVGYHFAPDAWGNGYATELVSQALKDARDRHHLPKVRAFVHSNNSASRRVLEKAGFEQVRFIPAMQRFLYERNLGSIPFDYH